MNGLIIFLEKAGRTGKILKSGNADPGGIGFAFHGARKRKLEDRRKDAALTSRALLGRGPTGASAFRALRDEEFDEGGGGGGLADPEEEHPFDDFRFELGHFGAEARSGGLNLGAKFFAVLIGHEPLREVSLLLAKGDFEALRDGAGLGGLDAGGFEDGEDFDRAHRVEEWWKGGRPRSGQKIGDGS